MRHKTKHTCESAITFDLGVDIIKENCDFQYYFNNTDVKPSVLDGGHEIILANWPNTKYVIIIFLSKFQATHMFYSKRQFYVIVV